MDYIESTQVLESTQNLCTNTNKSNQIVGYLVIKGINHSLFHGENTIGRDPSCSIVITDKPVSAKHAILEVENEALHCIYDLGSSNKTKLRKAILRPNVRYVLNDGDELVFANVPAIYKHVQVIPELENDADRTEILTVPETPEKEDKTVAEIPISRVYDSDDSNADLFDDSQSRRISFQIPTFEVNKEVEVKENNIYGICTQSKDSSIYELDTQSFVENCEKNVSIYDFETEGFAEKLKENIKTPIKEVKEVKRAPIITPSGSFEDLFCDSESSPEVKYIASNYKDEFKFSEDIFQASQGVEENNEVFINKKNEPLNCIESTSGLSKAGKFVLETSIFTEVNDANVLEKICISPINPANDVLENNDERITVENCLKLDQKITFSQNEQIESNFGDAEEINHSKIEQGGKSMDQQNLITENNCELEIIEENNGQVEEKQFEYSNQPESCENKINFVEQKNFWDLKTEFLTDHKKLNDIEKSENEIPAILDNKKIDEISTQQNVENCEEHIKDIFQNVDTLNCEDTILRPKNIWDMETEELTTEDLKELKNNLEQSEISTIMEYVQSEKVITKETKDIEKISPDKLSKKGESSNQPNEDVENCEDTILRPKNIWDMETEELNSEDLKELKNNLEQSEISILEDVQSKKVITEDTKYVDFSEKISPDKLSEKGSNKQNEEVENCEDTILGPKNIWDMETEELTTDHCEEKINFVSKNLREIETEIITENEGNFVAPKNIWDIETQEFTDHKQLKNIDNDEIRNILNYEEKINFAVPKNLWEIQTEDRNEIKNLEKEIAKIPEDVHHTKVQSEEIHKDVALSKKNFQDVQQDKSLKLNEKHAEISYQLNAEDENKCAIQHINEGLNNEDKIKFVEPKNVWEHEELNNIQEKTEIATVSEDAENNVAFSNVQDSEQIEESLTEQIRQLFNDSEVLDHSTSNIPIDNTNFKIPLQEKGTESNSAQKEDQIDSTLEDEDFEDFEPNECDFKKRENLDVESEMAKLFGTNSDNQIKKFDKNGEEDCNRLKRILEDAQELKNNDKDCLDSHKIDTETLKANLINSELSESSTFLKFNISKISLENHDFIKSEICTKPIKRDVSCSQDIPLINMEQNKGFKSPSNDSLNISDMSTQAIVINQDSNTEDKGFKSSSNDSLNISDMSTQAIVINQDTNTEHKGLKSPSNDSLNMSDMSTQAIVINQDTNTEHKGFKSPSNDSLNMSLADMCTQAIVINQDTNTEYKGFKSPSNSLNMSDMSTQAIVLNQDTNSEYKGFKSPSNDSLNMSDMCTQAIVTNQINAEQNKGFKSPSNDSLNISDMSTQAIVINQDTNTEHKGFKSPSNDSLNMSDMSTQAVVINQDTTEHKGFKSPSNDSLNMSFSDMSTQAIIIYSTEIDVFETTTINTDKNNDDNLKETTLSEMPTQAVLINSTEIDLETTAHDENNDNLKDLSEMPTQAVQIDTDENLQEINEKPQNDLNDINLSETQPIIVEKHCQDVIKNTLNPQNDDIKDVILSELPTTNMTSIDNSAMITQETVVYPPQKIRKSRINMNANKTEINVKNFKPKLALNINKHSSTLPNDINRTSFFIQQKTSQSLILESKKDVFDSSDDEDAHPNKRPRLFVISDDEDGDIPNKKSENAFEVDFKETKSVSKIRFKNKIYNSNESIYSAISMDETNVKDGLSDMEETLINKNIKFTMSPFLSKIIECETEDSPKKVTPKVKEFGRGKRTRVAKMFKDYETDDTSEPHEVLSKKIKLGFKKKSKTNDEKSNEEQQIHQPSGSNEEENVKQKRSKVAQKSENENVAYVSTENNHKNTRSRKTPIVRLGNNEKHIPKMAKNIKTQENPESSNEGKSENDRKISERSNRRKMIVKSSASETSSSSSISTNLDENNEQNIPNKTSKRTKNIKSENVKHEENPDLINERKDENDKKASDGRRKRTAKSSASETSSSSNSSNVKENNEPTIPNKTSKRTKNIRSEIIKPKENLNERKDENEIKTSESSNNRRKKTAKSSASETSSSSSSSTNKPSKSTKNMKKSSEENISVESKDCAENSTKLQENNEENIPNKRSKRTKNIKPEENPDSSENSDSRRKRIAKSSGSEISSSSSSSTNKLTKSTKNIKKSSEDNIPVEKKTKRTVKSSEPEVTSVPTSSKRVTRSRGKNEPGKLRILFNGNYDEDMPLIIDRLNGEIVENPYTCTVVVAEKIEPTVNFLCGLSQGRPIVTPSWLHCSRDAGYFIDPYKHLLFDREGEEKFLFCLKNSINKATQVLLLKGWSIFTTPSIEPSPTEFKSIVECSGGIFLKKIPSRWPQNSLVISCPDDEIKWSRMIEKRQKTPKIVSSEVFITSVLRQDLDFNTTK